MRRSRFRQGYDIDAASAPMPRLLKQAVFDGYEFGLLLEYFDGANEVLKTFSGKFVGGKDHPFYRYWRFPKRELQDNTLALFDALRAKLGGPIQETGEQFAAVINEAATTPVRSAFVHGVTATIYPIGDTAVALVCTFHAGVVSIARNMGGRYLPSMRAWKFADTSAATLKNNLVLELGIPEDRIGVFEGHFDIVDDQFSPVKFNEIGITIEGEFPERDGTSEAPDDEASEVYLSTTEPLAASLLSADEIDAAMVRYQLYDFQRDGVRHLASKTSALLADDMGLGKSRQAVVAADILTAGLHKVLIACPASLIVNWTREIRMILPDAEIATQAYSPTARWIVTNYERLEGLIRCAGEFMVMITDEVHFLKEPHVKRTRLAFDIASRIPYRFLLTGTPILNRESEMHTLLRLSGHPIGNMPLKQYEEQFSGSPEFRADLNRQIQEWMLRRMKDMVLKHLQGKQHQLLPIVVDDEQRSAYVQILQDDRLFPLQKIIKLRQWLEQVKLPIVVEMVQEMQLDDKILIFCEFKDTVEQFKEHLQQLGINVVTLTGDDSAARRQRTVDQFQNDPNVRVFIGTTPAAGVGLNLTAANYVIFTSLPWTPALKEQAEDRAFRNGQLRLVIVKIPLVENSIDNDLWAMLMHKKAIANEVLDPVAVQSALANALFKKAA